MADDVKKVEVAITSTYDGKGAQQAAADQEKLTNTGKGLATTIPDLNSKTQEYIVTSEAEYLAIQKAHDALVKKIPVLQAAGKDVTDYQRSIENLSAALSTNEAITIAESMEQKAVAAARLEAAAAARAEAVANNENSASSALSATSMREVLTIIRELEAGRLTRVPGSLSILLQQISGLGPVLQAGLIAGSAAAFILFDVVKGIHEEWVKMGEAIQKAAEQAAVPEFIQSIEKQREAVAAAAADMQGFADALASAAEKESDLNSQLQQELGLLQAIERARAALTGAQKELDIARIQRAENAGQITPEQGAEERAAIEQKYIRQEQQDRERAQNEELNSRQVALRAAQEQQAALDQQYRDAQAKANADKAHMDHVAVDPKTILEEIHKLQESMDAQRQIIAEPQSAADLGTRANLLHNDILEKEQAQMDMLEKQFQQFQATQTPEYQAKARADGDAASGAKQRAEDNNKLIGELTKQIADLKAEIAKVRPIEEQTTATKAQTVTEQEGGRIAKQFQDDARVISEYDRAKSPSAELISRAAVAIQEMQDMLREFGPLLQNISNLQGEISDLKQAVARAQNSANNHF